MLFNSGIFLFVFLPITFIVYCLLSRVVKNDLIYLWLIFASLFFYGWWYPPYLLLLSSSISINYIIGYHLRSTKNYRKLLLIFGIALNLGVIAYYKYAHFLLDNFNTLTGLDFYLGNIFLPLAISFFTFQQIAYLVDSYRNQVLTHNFIQYSFFVSFFPQLIAGPIVHHSQFFSQISKKIPEISIDKVAIGISIFFIGLFKKVIIADQLAQYATPVFDHAESGKTLAFFEAWVGVLSYTNQLYFDFSGYSDMAIGLALLFGIYLPLNFNSPYKSTSIIDFWRRWHITLSHFLRDYLYITLGGNRKGNLQRYLNLSITMLLGGLWHGANWTFVVWGALHGFYLVINHCWRFLLNLFNLKPVANSFFYKIIAFLLTYLAVVIAWVFFRAESFDAALSILQSMLGFNSISLPESLQITNAVFNGDWLLFEGANIHGGYWAVFWVVIASFITWFLPNTQQLITQFSDNLSDKSTSFGNTLIWQPNIIWALLLSLLASASLIMVIIGRNSEFLYFQF